MTPGSASAHPDHCTICGSPRADIASEDELPIVGGNFCGHCSVNLHLFSPTWYGIITPSDPRIEAYVYGVQPSTVDTYPPDEYPALVTNASPDTLSEHALALIDTVRRHAPAETDFTPIAYETLDDRQLASVFPVLGQLRLERHTDSPPDRAGKRLRDQLQGTLIFTATAVYSEEPEPTRALLRGAPGEYTGQGDLAAFTPQ